MSQANTLTLLPQTVYSSTPNPVYTVVGNAQPAAAYYLGNQDLQTVSMKLTSVTGNILIEATLATTPVEDDWFNVYTLQANLAANVNSNATLYTNINGNFVHMRARVEDFSTGIVNFVKLSY